MTLVFYSLFLNHHQACIADEFFKILGRDYHFVELSGSYDNKGASADYSTRPYLIQAWKSAENYEKAKFLALTADACVFAGYESLPFETARLKLGLMSFDMGERLLKRGIKNLASPRILKFLFAYYKNGWRNQPLYKLCCSAFTAEDCNNLGMFKGRCYKWGYFTAIDYRYNISFPSTISLMWCARFLTWKHPELVVGLAKTLKDSGIYLHIDIFGDEGGASQYDTTFPRTRLEELIRFAGVEDRITLRGTLPNNKIIEEMRHHQIFLFTSDKREGWGAVANESMANGCVLVASDAIGSTPYLIIDGFNGLVFKSGNVNSLTEKVKWLLTHPVERKQMQINAVNTMRSLWNPRNAAQSLLKLIGNLERGKETEISKGPCSKA